MEDSEPLLVETTVIKSSDTDSIRPVTVYQALQAERLPGDVQFTLGGTKFAKVLLVAHVMLRPGGSTTDVRGAYDLEDGTGRIYGTHINTAGQDSAAAFSNNTLACVMGKLVQSSGRQNMVSIESMAVAGYHQAMVHILECMVTSLIIEKGPPPRKADETVVAQELEGNSEIAINSGAFDQLHHSFLDLPQNDHQGGNVDFPQTAAPLLQSYEGSSSVSTSMAQAEPQLPTRLPAPEPETTHSAIARVTHPRAVARTPSPLSSFGSSLRISSHSVPQYNQLAQLTATQLAIVSSLGQLQDNPLYGFWIADVFKSVTQVIETTWEEFR
ncbi:hypothetical protein DFH29DRAFT_894876 [Suillus ampliporus]|nr:hypothetical protein DFH29DRAFT_894876 [Suillus ampliporus]